MLKTNCGDDQAPARLALIALQQGPQMIEIVVAEPLLPQPRRSNAMMQAGVVEAVRGRRSAQQLRHRSQVGGIGLNPALNTSAALAPLKAASFPRPRHRHRAFR